MLLLARQSACFVVGKTALPAEVADAIPSLASAVTCDTSTTTISGVPDVVSNGVTFSSINFSKSKLTPLGFALSKFATASPLASSDLAKLQDQLNVYLATEAGVRSVGGSLAVKIPKFFLQFQMARINAAKGTPSSVPGQDVQHQLTKVLNNAAGESQTLRDQVSALATQLK